MEIKKAVFLLRVSALTIKEFINNTEKMLNIIMDL